MIKPCGSSEIEKDTPRMWPFCPSALLPLCPSARAPTSRHTTNKTNRCCQWHNTGDDDDAAAADGVQQAKGT